MLFPVQKNKSVYESAPGLRLIPEFQELEWGDDKKMRFVMLVADFKSPLRQHPEQKRRELAALDVGYKTRNGYKTDLTFRAKELVEGKDEKVELAIKKYKEIQHNEDRVNLDMVSRQIENIQKALLEPSTDLDELKRRNVLLQTLPDLVETRNRLAKLAGIKEEELSTSEIPDERPLSLIDKIHAENQE